MDARVEAGIWRECLRHSPANGDGERSTLGGLHSLVDVWHPQPPVLQRDLPPFGATPPIATALPAPLVDEAFSHALYGISPHGLGGLGGLDQPRQLPYSPLHPGLYALGSSHPLAATVCVLRRDAARNHAPNHAGQDHTCGTGFHTLPGMYNCGGQTRQPQLSLSDGHWALETVPPLALNCPAFGATVAAPDALSQRLPLPPAPEDWAARDPQRLGSSTEPCNLDSSNSLSFGSTPVARAGPTLYAPFVASPASNGIYTERQYPSHHEVVHGTDPMHVAPGSASVLIDVTDAAQRIRPSLLDARHSYTEHGVDSGRVDSTHFHVLRYCHLLVFI